MTSIVMLALNGEGIPLKDMRVTPTMQIQDKDQSGQTSSTGTAEQGIKPKELRVSGVVPYANPEILKRIFELAQAKDTAGKQQTYRVAHLVANTIGFREATFTGTVDAPQQDGKMAWLVTFTLREKQSVPEKKEARAGNKTAAQKQTQNGGGKVGSGSSAEDSEKLSWFESRVLKPINDGIGPA